MYSFRLAYYKKIERVVNLFLMYVFRNVDIGYKYCIVKIRYKRGDFMIIFTGKKEQEFSFQKIDESDVFTVSFPGFPNEKWDFSRLYNRQKFIVILDAIHMLCQETQEIIEVSKEEMETILYNKKPLLDVFEEFLFSKNEKLYLLSKSIRTGEFLFPENIELQKIIKHGTNAHFYIRLKLFRQFYPVFHYDTITKECFYFSHGTFSKFHIVGFCLYQDSFPVYDRYDQQFLKKFTDLIHQDPVLRMKLLFV